MVFTPTPMCVCTVYSVLSRVLWRKKYTGMLLGWDSNPRPLYSIPSWIKFVNAKKIRWKTILIFQIIFQYKNLQIHFSQNNVFQCFGCWQNLYWTGIGKGNLDHPIQNPSEINLPTSKTSDDIIWSELGLLNQNTIGSDIQWYHISNSTPGMN